MRNILEDLYVGNLGFDCNYYAPNSPFVKAAQKKHDSLEQLMTILGEREKELFEQYCSAQSDMEGIARYETYSETLKFGIGLMIELLQDA